MALFELPAVPENVHWGYFDRNLRPCLRVRHGDVVRIETVKQHGGVYPERLLNPTVQAIFDRVLDRGPGTHILTGPIAMAGSEPGDALEVRLLSLEAPDPYGMCAQLPIGLLSDGDQRRSGTVLQADFTTGRARALFRFTYPEPAPPHGTPLRVPREPALKGVRIPLRPHLGIAGVAPDQPGRVTSMTPGRFGGNLDQWRFGPGTSLLLPVLAPESLFSCGDGHLAQGDGEVTGNGIEASLTATVQFLLHKRRAVHNPVLETPTCWAVHAFAPTLDEACRLAGVEALDFLAARGLDRRDAYTLLGLAADFGITQVVDGDKGVHVLIPKDLFAPREEGRA